MKAAGCQLDELARRHLAEVEAAIAEAAAGREDWRTILALKAAARAYRGLLRLRRPAEGPGLFSEGSRPGP